MQSEQYIMVRISILLFWSSLISLMVQSCSNGKVTNDNRWREYQIYDLSYNGRLYVGVCQYCVTETQHPQFIVYEIKAIKDYYSKYGMDSLLDEFAKWYYSNSRVDDGEGVFVWTLPQTNGVDVPWSPLAERYLIYLAIRNGYHAIEDCESGYLYFEK